MVAEEVAGEVVLDILNTDVAVLDVVEILNISVQSKALQSFLSRVTVVDVLDKKAALL